MYLLVLHFHQHQLLGSGDNECKMKMG